MLNCHFGVQCFHFLALDNVTATPVVIVVRLAYTPLRSDSYGYL